MTAVSFFPDTTLGWLFSILCLLAGMLIAWTGISLVLFIRSQRRALERWRAGGEPSKEEA